jgi:hypothetical protein
LASGKALGACAGSIPVAVAECATGFGIQLHRFRDIVVNVVHALVGRGCHSLVGQAFGFGQLVGVLLASRDNHGLFKFVLFGLRRLLIGETQLVVADGYHVTVLQRMFFDQLAIDVSAIGAVQVLKE